MGMSQKELAAMHARQNAESARRMLKESTAKPGTPERARMVERVNRMLKG